MRQRVLDGLNTTTAESPASIRKIALASAIGATIEWYDFFLFGIVSGLVFNKLFFPTFDPFVGTMLAYTTFAVGFLARPLGGIIFGHFGDKIGRKRMLVLTLLIMGIATFLIGVLPTYDSLGIWAPALLLLLRVGQGIGVGGEWGGAVLMAVEHSPKEARGFYGSWPQIGAPAGLCLGTGVVALLTLRPETEFLRWGWRAAFLLSGALVVVGLYIRFKIMETPAFSRVQATSAAVSIPVITLLHTHPKSLLLGMGARYIEGVCFNVYAVFAISYLTGTLKIPRATALLAVTIAALVMIFFLPIWGKLSDRYGRRLVFGVGSILSGLLVFPAFWGMNVGGHTAILFLAIVLPLGVIFPAIYGPEAALFSELFDTRVRYTGISFIYQVSGVFASGLTPLIATTLLAAGGGKPWLIGVYVLGVSLISAVSVYVLRETSQSSMIDVGVPL